MTAHTPSGRNIMLITFDDAVAFWKYKAVFGQTLHTPNLDRICAQSTAFHAAYTQAPVCSPSRASFMSGKAPHHSGLTTPYKEVFEKIPPQDMWPYLLKQNGYFNSSGGKVMQGFPPIVDDIHSVIYSDEPKSFRVDWKVPPAISMEFGGFRGGKATISEEYDRRFYDFQASKSAIQFLKAQDGTQPFYREVGFYGPHGPWITPRRFKDMYDADKFRMPEAWGDGIPGHPYLDQYYTRNFDPSRVNVWRKSVRNYFSALSHADHHLGRVWDALKASPHADNTIVIIASDHGMHLGERNRFRKHTLWEQVANVPLIVHDPARPVAHVVTDPVALIDIGPTVMDYAGLPPLEGTPGRSLRPLCEWGHAPDRAVPTILRDNAGVRKGKYRFIRYEDGSTEFFDLAQDWWQTRNLGPDHPDYAEMQEAHAACCLEYGLDVSQVEAAA
ncbi:MAG: sulfatase-like hydrolase/transferase [Pseudomonadota bacterium]